MSYISLNGKLFSPRTDFFQTVVYIVERLYEESPSIEAHVSMFHVVRVNKEDRSQGYTCFTGFH